MILHIQSTGRVGMRSDFVYALSKLRVGIGDKTRTHASVRGLKTLASIFAQVVPSRGNAQVHAGTVAYDRV